MTAQLKRNDQAAQLGPLEALRFFCSQHLPAQAWLESEPLFNAVAAQDAAAAAERERCAALCERTYPEWNPDDATFRKPCFDTPAE